VRKVLPWASAVAMLLGISRPCLAQKPKPLLTASFSGYDELMKDVGLIGKLADFPLAEILEGYFQQQEEYRNLAPFIDRKKP